MTGSSMVGFVVWRKVRRVSVAEAGNMSQTAAPPRAVAVSFGAANVMNSGLGFVRVVSDISPCTDPIRQYRYKKHLKSGPILRK
jgi:hypothetical protein